MSEVASNITRVNLLIAVSKTFTTYLNLSEFNHQGASVNPQVPSEHSSDVC